MGAAGDAAAWSRVAAAILNGPVTRDREASALAALSWMPAPGTARFVDPGRVGAALRFEGVVRRSEPRAAGGGQDHDLAALDYQTYDPMAERQMLALSREIAERHGLIGLAALHSRGRVAVGEVSLVLIVESVHRAEALCAMSEFIDRLKQDVPIWKQAVWAE